MGKRKAKAGETPAPALADMTKEQLIDLAGEKGVENLDSNMEKEEIIKVLIEADPSLSAGPAENDEGDDDDDDEKESESTPEESGGEIKQCQLDGVKVGTIRTIQGVEMVKINNSANGWVPTIRENISEGKPMTIVCQKRAGKTIFAATGKPITFDANGRATVSAVDGYYLQNIIINGTPEYTVE